MAFDAGSIESRLELDRDPFQRGLREAVQEAAEFSRRSWTATIGVDTTQATTRLAELDRVLTQVGNRRITPVLDVDTTRARAVLEAFGRDLPNIKIGVEIGDTAGLRETLRARLAEIGAGLVIPVGVEIDAAGLRELLRARLAEASAGQEVHVGVNIDRSPFDALASSAGGAGSAVGGLPPLMAAVGVAALALAPAIAPVFGLLGALPGLGIGLAQFAGTAKLGFSGVGDALKAMATADSNAGTDALAAAKQHQAAADARIAATAQVKNAQDSLKAAQQSAAYAAVNADEQIRKAREAVSTAEQTASRSDADSAQRVKDAQESLATARTSAADSAVAANERIRKAREAVTTAEETAARSDADSARKVTDARQTLADTEQSVAETIVAAQGRIGDAERSLADAQHNERQAQEDLTQSREDAIQKMEDLTRAVEHGSLSEQESVLRVAEARQRYAKVTADGSKATALERESARLGVLQALSNLDDVRLRNRRNAEDLAEQQKAGINGERSYVSALDRVRAAHQSVGKARESIGKAQEALNRAQEQGAIRIAHAQEAVTIALQAGQRAHEDGLRRISDAQAGVGTAMRAAQRQAESSAVAVAHAQENVTRAVQNSARAHQDGLRRIADAQAGVVTAVRNGQRVQEQSARSVAQAQTQVAAAMRALERTMRTTGQQGSASMQAVQKAMANLTPAGREFVMFLRGIKPEFDTLKTAAQAGLLPGVEAGIRNLLPVLPVLREGVSGTARALGGFATSLGALVGAPAFRSELRSILQGNVVAFKDIGRGIVSFIDGLVRVGAAAVPLVEWLGRMVAEGGKLFASWAAGASASGGLTRLFTATRIAVTGVMEVLGNLTGAIINVFSGADTVRAGQGFLTTLVNITGRMREWTASVRGQHDIAVFFHGVYTAVGLLGGAVVLLWHGFQELWRVLGPVVGALTNLVGQVKAFLDQHPALEQMVKTFGGLGGALGIIVKFTPVLSVLGKSFSFLTGPIGLTIAGITALSAALVYVYDHSKPFRDAVAEIRHGFELFLKVFSDNNTGGVSGFFRGLAAGVRAAWPIIKPALADAGHALVQWIQDATPPALHQLGIWARAAGDWISAHGVPLLVTAGEGLAKALWWWVTKVEVPMYRELGSLLLKLGAWLWNTGLPWLGSHLAKWGQEFVDWVAPRVGPLLEQFGKLVGYAVGWLLFTGLPKLIGALALLGGSLIAWIIPRIPGALMAFLEFMDKIRLWIWNVGFPKMFKAMYDFGKGILEGLWKAFKDSTIISAIGGFFHNITGAVGEIFTQMWTSLHDTAVSGANRLISVLNTFMGAINSIAGSVGLHLDLHINPVEHGGGNSGGPVNSASATRLAAGGMIPTSVVGAGFVTDGPRAIVGEGNPRHAEYVIPTDPQHRTRAQGLFRELGPQLLATGGIIDTHQTGWRSIIEAVRDTGQSFGYPADTQITHGTHAAGSEHYQGRAVDFGTATSNPDAIFRALRPYAMGGRAAIDELFWDPSGEGWKNGSNIGPIGHHSDHVHVGIPAGEDLAGMLAGGPGHGPGLLGQIRSGIGGLFDAGLASAAHHIADPVKALIGHLTGGRGSVMGLLGGAAGTGVDAVVNGIIGGGSGGGGGAATASAALGGGGMVQRWAPVVLQVLRELGLNSGLVGKVLRQINTESGGNPNAIQGIHDINSGGNEAQGLMQVIPPTFRANAGPYLALGPFNPHASIYAGLHYAEGRYGPDLSYLGQGHGYEFGTAYVPRTGPAVLHQGEIVLPRGLSDELRRFVGVAGARQQVDGSGGRVRQDAMAAAVRGSGRHGPLMHVENLHADTTSLDLVLQQAQFRELQGAF